MYISNSLRLVKWKPVLAVKPTSAWSTRMQRIWQYMLQLARRYTCMIVCGLDFPSSLFNLLGDGRGDNFNLPKFSFIASPYCIKSLKWQNIHVILHEYHLEILLKSVYKMYNGKYIHLKELFFVNSSDLIVSTDLASGTSNTSPSLSTSGYVLSSLR